MRNKRNGQGTQLPLPEVEHQQWMAWVNGRYIPLPPIVVAYHKEKKQ